MSTAPRLKLRNSCRPCANSKVKCDSGKPICSRCEERGIECLYLRSKRPGRVPGGGARRNEQQQTPINDLSVSNGDLPVSNGDTVDTVDPANTSINHELVPAVLAPCSSSAVDMGCTANNSSYATNSLQDSPVGASETDWLTASSETINGDQNSYLDLDDIRDPVGGLSVLSSIRDGMYSSLMDCDSYLGDLNFWRPFDDTDADAPVSVDSGENLPKEPEPPRASDASTSANISEPRFFASSSSSSSSALVLSSGPQRSTSSSILGNIRTPSTSTQLDVSGGTGRPESAGTLACDCMPLALDLLKKLSDVRSSDGSRAFDAGLTQKVLIVNKQAVEASQAMLACRSCSNDRFLLMILLMITTKILARYASAAVLCGAKSASAALEDNDALQMPNSLQRERSASSASSDHADRLVEMSRAWGGNGMLPHLGASDEQLSPREAVQRVLRELHQVQRLITQVSTVCKRLDSQEANVGYTAGLFEAPPVQIREYNSNKKNNNNIAPANVAATAPLTVRTLDLVEGNVRRSFSTLSAVLRDMLKNS